MYAGMHATVFTHYFHHGRALFGGRILWWHGGVFLPTLVLGAIAEKAGLLALPQFCAPAPLRVVCV